MVAALLKAVIASMAGPEAADEIARLMATAPAEAREPETQLRDLLEGDVDSRAAALRYFFNRKDSKGEQPSEQNRLNTFMRQPLSGTEAREALLSILQIVPGTGAALARRQYSLPADPQEHAYAELDDFSLTPLHHDSLAAVIHGSLYMADQVVAQNSAVVAWRILDADGHRDQIAAGISGSRRAQNLTPSERQQIVVWAFTTAQTLVMKEFERHESLRAQLRGEMDDL